MGDEHDKHERAATSGAMLGSVDTLLGVSDEDRLFASVPSSRRSLRAAEIVGEQFQVVRPLGEGGMGEVFIAQDLSLGRRVALKTLKLPRGGAGPGRERFVQMFRRDAASTAQLSHPNIVTIFQFGEHHGLPFFVLELVEGTPLDEELTWHGPMGELEVLELGIQLCAALSYAHERGMIHRDIKPSNLMRSDTGQLKVLDFGIALMRVARDELAEQFDRTRDELDQHLGAQQATAGTPAYMAPEQMRGLFQDARVDVWAAGVTLYELLAGRRPYRDARDFDGGLEIPWPPRVQVSARTRRAIEGCLTVSMTERTQTMAELGDQLERALASLSVPGYAPVEERTTNLSVVGDAFVGRHAESTQLDRLVLHERRRLVTLVGPGGVGKTRLVTQWGLDALEHRGVRSVRMCALGEAAQRDGVLRAVGDALDVPLTGDDPVAQLGWALEHSSGLVLILDNCEQVADDVAELLRLWLSGAPGVRVVATSRVPLGGREEYVLRLEPLEESAQAVALYTERARERDHSWVCPRGEESALEELVRELDGLPLAIELAAARASLLSPKKMLARLGRRFALLRSSRRGVSARQATMHGAIAWSWELLDAACAMAMEQLSVFEGRFTLEAAEAVVEFSDLEGEAPFVLDVVDHLVSASLLRSDGSSGRFSMLHRIRAFSRERLDADAGRASRARARHAGWFARRGLQEVERELGRGIPTLIGAAGDLDVASAWALAPGQDDATREHGLVCAALLAALVTFKGPFAEAEGLVQRVEAVGELSTVGASRALGRLGHLVHHTGRPDEAMRLWTRAMQIAQELGDEALRGMWLGHMGSCVFHRGEVERAREMILEALEIARAEGDRDSEGAWLGGLGSIAQGSGALELARGYFEQALEIAHELGMRRDVGTCLSSLGNIERKQGRLEQARQHYAGALRVAEEVGDASLEGAAHGNLGAIQKARGELEAARRSFERALEAGRKMGNRYMECIWLGNMGDLLRDMGESAAAARSHFERALELAREIDDLRLQGAWLGNLGDLEREHGSPEEAVRLFKQGLDVARALGDRHMESSWLVSLGMLERERGDVGAARALFEEARGLASQLHDTYTLFYCEVGLGLCAHDEGHSAEAMASFEQCVEWVTGFATTRASETAQELLSLAEALGVEVPYGTFMD